MYITHFFYIFTVNFTKKITVEIGRKVDRGRVDLKRPRSRSVRSIFGDRPRTLIQGLQNDQNSAVFDVLKLPNLISRKIWAAVNFTLTYILSIRNIFCQVGNPISSLFYKDLMNQHLFPRLRDNHFFAISSLKRGYLIVLAASTQPS